MIWKRNDSQLDDEYPVEGVEETGGDVAVAELEEEDEQEEASLTPEEEEAETAKRAEFERIAALRRELHQEVIAKMEPGNLGKMGEDKLKIEIRRQLEIILSQREDLAELGDPSQLIDVPSRRRLLQNLESGLPRRVDEAKGLVHRVASVCLLGDLEYCVDGDVRQVVAVSVDELARHVQNVQRGTTE